MAKVFGRQQLVYLLCLPSRADPTDGLAAGSQESVKPKRPLFSGCALNAAAQGLNNNASRDTT